MSHVVEHAVYQSGQSKGLSFNSCVEVPSGKITSIINVPNRKCCWCSAEQKCAILVPDHLPFIIKHLGAVSFDLTVKFELTSEYIFIFNVHFPHSNVLNLFFRGNKKSLNS